MAKYSKQRLIENLVDAVQGEGVVVEYRTPRGVHPALLNVRTEEFSRTFRVYIWNLSRGGANRPADEYRVQTSGVNSFEQKAGESTLILGYWSELELFVAFDWTKHASTLGSSVSLQIRERPLNEALERGIATYLKNNELVVVFNKANALSYLTDCKTFHSSERKETAQKSFDYSY